MKPMKPRFLQFCRFFSKTQKFPVSSPLRPPPRYVFTGSHFFRFHWFQRFHYPSSPRHYWTHIATFVKTRKVSKVSFHQTLRTNTFQLLG